MQITAIAADIVKQGMSAMLPVTSAARPRLHCATITVHHHLQHHSSTYFCNPLKFGPFPSSWLATFLSGAEAASHDPPTSETASKTSGNCIQANTSCPHARSTTLPHPHIDATRHNHHAALLTNLFSCRCDITTTQSYLLLPDPPSSALSTLAARPTVHTGRQTRSQAQPPPDNLSLPFYHGSAHPAARLSSYSLAFYSTVNNTVSSDPHWRFRASTAPTQSPASPHDCHPMPRSPLSYSSPTRC
ncbi:hypothetical protein IF1G_07344 [Cordyceps javanica]|uniref:Uncharacterized protein n=1 Tax=Cordyceps javanica TaxID=43265 RepID=A0A545UVX8_9HYPO|nr:hypothetical protein IF1G_07344 [Cordyceps javanica]